MKFYLKLTVFLVFACISLETLSGEVLQDTIHLQEVTVTGSKAPAVYSELSRIVTVITKYEIERLPIQSISGILEYAISVDVRERGPAGVQADLSIRGGSFEQVLVLLNGIKMNDPQTGHHHLNLPVDIQSIERIEILEGSGSRIFGPYAYAGAINIITKNNEGNKFGLSFTGGEHSFMNGALSADFLTGNISNGISISRKSSKGYIENTDFEIFNVFYSAGRNVGKLHTELQTGYMQKEFGANSFYTPAYPDQFEKVRTSFISLKNTYGLKGKFIHNVYFRRHNDRFELFRYEPAPWYRGHNYHRTDVYGTEGLYTIPWKFGTSALGTEFRTEKIFSNVLGEPMADTIWINRENNVFYNKYKKRDNVSFFGEHKFYLYRFNLSVGILSNYNEDFGWKIYSGLDLSYSLTDKLKLYFSFNESLRMPSFTDLYYVGPSNLGNPSLKPEEAINYESGLKYKGKGLTGHFLIFLRDGKNIIDWVRIADSLKWESKNLTELSTIGYDLKLNFDFGEYFNIEFPVEKISIGYSWLKVTKQSENYISVYALDQLKHKLTMSLYHELIWNIKVSWYFNYQDRNGTYTQFPSRLERPYEPFFTVDSKIFYQYKSLHFFSEVTNIFNKDYFDFGNILQPGRWIRFGISSSFLLNN